MIVNDQAELLSFQLTAANTDDRKPVADLTYSIFGKLFGDKGYIPVRKVQATDPA